MKRIGIMVAVIATALAGVATGQPRTATRQDWVKWPSSEDLSRVYPIKAMQSGLGGLVKLDCQLGIDGALLDCRVGEETPPGAGFGEAALALAPQFLLKPAQKDGHPVPVAIRIPIAFRAPRPYTGPVVPQSLLTAVGWIEAPTYAETAAAYPKKARESRTPGHATLNCQIKADGYLTSCRPITEAPEGEGFGAAAKDLAKRFRAPLTLDDGHSTRGAAVTLPITFTVEMLDGQQRIGKPLWTHLPSPQEFEAAFPKPTATLTVAIIMDCAVAAGGSLADCRIESETPAGQGYGAAALGLMGRFNVSLWTAEGLPVMGGRMRVPLRYVMQ